MAGRTLVHRTGQPSILPSIRRSVRHRSVATADAFAPSELRPSGSRGFGRPPRSPTASRRRPRSRTGGRRPSCLLWSRAAWPSSRSPAVRPSTGRAMRPTVVTSVLTAARSATARSRVRTSPPGRPAERRRSTRSRFRRGLCSSFGLAAIHSPSEHSDDKRRSSLTFELFS